jgi:hypothetical protein
LDEDHSAHPFKGNLDHHASADRQTSDVAKDNLPQRAADNLPHGPVQHADNGSPTVTDGAHPPNSDLPASADPDLLQHPDDSFKFADDGSAHPDPVPHDSPPLTALSGDLSGDHGPAAPALAQTSDVPGAVMSEAAPKQIGNDQFIFGKDFGHDAIADLKPDMIEIDPTTIAEIKHLLDIAPDTNAVSALNPTDGTAPQDMTKVQAPYQGDFHFA